MSQGDLPLSDASLAPSEVLFPFQDLRIELGQGGEPHSSDSMSKGLSNITIDAKWNQKLCSLLKPSETMNRMGGEEGSFTFLLFFFF